VVQLELVRVNLLLLELQGVLVVDMALRVQALEVLNGVLVVAAEQLVGLLWVFLKLHLPLQAQLMVHRQVK
jgi:hypothetical protein